MSGGAWNYCGRRLEEDLLEVANDERVKKRFPSLARALRTLGPILNRIEHDLDWDVCCDSPIHHDRQWEIQQLIALDQIVRWPYPIGRYFREDSP